MQNGENAFHSWRHLQAYIIMASLLGLNFHPLPPSVPVFTGSNLSHRCSTYNVSFFHTFLKIVSRTKYQDMLF